MAAAKAPMEVFPDLHHKMSKKIAQLTKVIYHLNTKNEDHQTEMDIMAANNQLEIQQILRDAATRISKFKETMENRQSSINSDAKLEKLQKKHDMEKQTALQEFSNFKSKVSEREQKISSEFQKKFDGLRKELEGMNSKFQEKIAAFEAKNKDLKKAIDSANSAGSAGMEEMRKRHEQELEDSIKTGNEKYQTMLLQKLAEIEALKKEMTLKLAAQESELTKKFKAELETELGQVRAKLSGDKQEAIMQLKREFEEKLSNQKSDMMGKMEKLLADLKAKSADIEAIISSKDSIINDLNEQLRQTQLSMGDQLGGQEQKMASLAQEIVDLKNKNIDLQAKVKERDEEVDIYKNMVSEKSAGIAELQKELQAAKDKIVALQKELDASKSSGASNEQELRAKLAAAEKESASFRAEINQIAGTLASVRDELKKAEKSAQKAAQEAEKHVQALTADNETLKAKIQELIRSSGAISEGAAKELADLKQAMIAKEQEMLSDRELLQNGHNKSLAALKDSHKSAIDAAQAAADLEAQRAKQREEQLTSDLASQTAALESKLESALRDSEILHKEMIERHTVEVESLKSSLTALEDQLQHLTESSETEKRTLKEEFAKVDAKYKALQKEFEKNRKEGAQAESVTTALKNQIETLREELKANQKAFRDKMDMDKSKLEAIWQEKLDKQKAEAEEALAKATGDAGKYHEEQMEALRAEHALEVKTLKQIIQEEATKAANELARSEQRSQDFEGQLKDEKLARSAQVADLSSKHSTLVKDMEEKHRNEVDRLRKELTGSSEAREKALVAAHTTETTRLKNLLESTIAEDAEKLEHAMKKSATDAAAELKRQLAEQEATLLKQKAEELAEQEQANAQDAAEMKSKYEHDKQLINAELADIKKQLVDSGKEIAMIQKLVADERAERQRREEAFIVERDQLQRDRENDIRKEKENSENQLIEADKRHQVDIGILKEEHMGVRSQYDNKLREGMEMYRALEVKYRNRESRIEDLQRIQQLEQEMVEKDELVAKTREEMMYFKREMLNREENYNSKFNSAPNVGVMQVLKTKQDQPPPGPKGIMGSGKSSTKMRMVNPNGGAMMMPPIGGDSMGMGGGLGGSGLGSKKY